MEDEKTETCEQLGSLVVASFDRALANCPYLSADFPNSAFFVGFCSMFVYRTEGSYDERLISALFARAVAWDKKRLHG